VETQEGNGIVNKKTIRLWPIDKDGNVSGIADSTIRPKHPEHYRVQDGFIEIGNRFGEDDTITWQPQLKLNARKGDTWESQFMPGMNYHYRILGFTRYQDRNCVIVESEGTLPSAPGRIANRTWYAVGIGKVKGEAAAEIDGATMTRTSSFELEDFQP
jgi:hypothetical protein